MSETLPSAEDPTPQHSVQPIITYTGVPWTPIICVVDRNAKAVSSAGIVEYDPSIVSLEQFNYYERVGGNLQTLSCNMTHCNFGFTVSSANLTSLAFDELLISDGYINCGQLTTLSLPKLTRTTVNGGLDFNSSALVTLDLPNLENIGSFFSMNMPALETLTLPKLKTVGSITWNTNLLLYVNMPVLEYVAGNFIVNAAEGYSITLPELTRIDGALTIHAELVLIFTFPKIKHIGGNVTIDASLNSSYVTDILVRLSLLDGTNGTTLFENKTVNLRFFGNEPPDPPGEDAILVLTSRGCTVTTS